MTSSTSQTPLRKWGIALRIVTAIVGGWTFAWGFVACGTAALVGLGVEFHDAEMALLMLGLLVFLAVFMWSFAVSSVLRVCVVLVPGAVLMNIAALLLQRAILS